MAPFPRFQAFYLSKQDSNRIDRDGPAATVERSVSLRCGRPTLNRTARIAYQTARLSEDLGEREFPIPIKSYGHPERIYTEEMVRVPWFEAAPDDRKEVVAEPSQAAYHQKQTDDVDEQAREHLKQMGYL